MDLVAFAFNSTVSLLVSKSTSDTMISAMMFFFTWLARNTNGATPTGRCLRTKTDRHPVESKTLCDFHLKPQHPSAAQERWEKVEEEEQEDKNKRLIEGKIVLSQKA